MDDSDEEAKTDYSSSNDSDASELGFDDVLAEAREGQTYEDDSKVHWKDYKYCISRDDNEIPSEAVMRETQMRKVQFIVNEIINDLGIQKGTFMSWFTTFALSFLVFELRMVVHYLGQFVFLKLINCPVTELDFRWYKVKLEYSYWDWIQ